MTRWRWQFTIDTSRAALARFGEAIIDTGAHVVDTHTFIKGRLGRDVTAVVMVSLNEGDEERFAAICKPHFGEMKPPPLVQVGMVKQPDDGHPGRRR